MKTTLRSLVATCALVLLASPLYAGKIASDLGSDSLVQQSKSKLEPYDASSLSDVKYYAIYYSALWCPPCRAFTPELVEFYNRAKKNHPNFEVIFVSRDKDETKMMEYMRDYRMKWPALKFKHRSIVGNHKGSGIPNLVFVDADNNVIKASYENGEYVGPRAVLDVIRKHLAAEGKTAQASQKPDGIDPFKNKEVNVFGR